MNFWKWLRRSWNLTFSPKRAAVTDPTRKIATSGRVSSDSLSTILSSMLSVTPPSEDNFIWSFNHLDLTDLDHYTPKQLLDILVNTSPEISKAAWDFQRLCNPGFECKAYNLGSEKSEHVEAKAYIDTFFDRLRSLYGSVDIVLGRFFMGAFLRGAFCGEIVLDANAEEAVDLATPDPYSIRFRKQQDSVRGEVWQAGQVQNGKFVPLDIPTFRYLPIDPAPASPYGRSLAAPALFTAIFILSLLQDVKRVVMQQGYKRMSIRLDNEQAMDNYSFDNQGFASLGAYIEDALAQIRTVYRTLQPEDAFIHTDMFTLEVPVGTVDADSIGAIDVIIERLEKQITRALKSNSLVMDTENQTSESDSNRRWEIHTAGIKSLQHHCEAMLESLLTVALQAKGIQAKVEFRFAELRAAEMFRDEQTMAMRIQNARNLYEAGYASQDEAANYAINHDSDVPEPRKALNTLDFNEDNNSGQEELNKPEEEVNRIKEMFEPEVHVNGNGKETNFQQKAGV